MADTEKLGLSPADLCAPILRSKPFTANGWLFEPKHDGYRAFVRRAGPEVGCCRATGSPWLDRSQRSLWRRWRACLMRLSANSSFLIAPAAPITANCSADHSAPTHDNRGRGGATAGYAHHLRCAAGRRRRPAAAVAGRAQGMAPHACDDAPALTSQRYSRNTRGGALRCDRRPRLRGDSGEAARLTLQGGPAALMGEDQEPSLLQEGSAGFGR